MRGLRSTGRGSSAASARASASPFGYQVRGVGTPAASQASCSWRLSSSRKVVGRSGEVSLKYGSSAARYLAKIQTSSSLAAKST